MAIGALVFGHQPMCEQIKCLVIKGGGREGWGILPYLCVVLKHSILSPLAIGST
jgi:hypothetical protein